MVNNKKTPIIILIIILVIFIFILINSILGVLYVKEQFENDINSSPYQDRKVGIIFKDNITDAKAQEIIAANGLEIEEKIDDDPLTYIILTPEGKESEVVEELNKLPEVKEAGQIPNPPT